MKLFKFLSRPKEFSIQLHVKEEFSDSKHRGLSGIYRFFSFQRPSKKVGARAAMNRPFHFRLGAIRDWEAFIPFDSLVARNYPRVLLIDWVGLDEISRVLYFHCCNRWDITRFIICIRQFFILYLFWLVAILQCDKIGRKKDRFLESSLRINSPLRNDWKQNFENF